MVLGQILLETYLLGKEPHLFGHALGRAKVAPRRTMDVEKRFSCGFTQPEHSVGVSTIFLFAFRNVVIVMSMAA